MPIPIVLILTSLAMLAFACNSLLCRLALKQSNIDAASFTLIRLVSGAIMLWLIVLLRHAPKTNRGNWLSALALFLYAAGFSFAYVTLSVATGALILFGAVQVTMIGHGFWSGERFTRRQTSGFIFAFAGLIGLLIPGVSAPPLFGSALMMIAGIAWGGYSLRGKGQGDPINVTAGNFLLAIPFAVIVSLTMIGDVSLDRDGVIYAVVSGAVASGIGYAVWYTALPGLKATQAATVQLSVPVLASLGGVVVLGESVGWRLVLATIAILGGIAMVIQQRVKPVANTIGTKLSEKRKVVQPSDNAVSS